jgi:hypothetical protein
MFNRFDNGPLSFGKQIPKGEIGRSINCSAYHNRIDQITDKTGKPGLSATNRGRAPYPNLALPSITVE